MKTKLTTVILFLITLSLNLFSAASQESPDFVLSIVPQHNQGLFVEFTSIGLSLGNSELSTQPIFDILGLFNLKWRYYLSPTNVFSFETYLFDPLFVGKAYAGQPYDQNSQIYLLFNRTLFHSNTFLNPLVLRPYGELLSVLIGNYNFSEYAGSTVARGFISVGYLISKNLELFGTLESGVAINVWTSETVSNDEWNNFITELRQKTIYSTFRVGVSWYYDNYSGLELGYRVILTGQDSPLRYIQGFTTTDWIYNYFKSQESAPYSIPFITTDYYISFSTKF